MSGPLLPNAIAGRTVALIVSGLALAAAAVVCYGLFRPADRPDRPAGRSAAPRRPDPPPPDPREAFPTPFRSLICPRNTPRSATRFERPSSA